MTAVIIVTIICASLIIITLISECAKVIDRKNYYTAKIRKPEAFNYIEEDDE